MQALKGTNAFFKSRKFPFFLYTFVCFHCKKHIGFSHFSSDDLDDGSSSAGVVLHALSFDVPKGIRAIEFSPCGKYLVACSEEKRIKIWTVTDWTTSSERCAR